MLLAAAATRLRAPAQQLARRLEHTLTELDSLIDWEIVAGMSRAAGCKCPAPV